MEMGRGAPEEAPMERFQGQPGTVRRRIPMQKAATQKETRIGIIGAAALGGLDTLVFAAGIGENAPLIRQRICNGLGFLGIKLNRKRNAKNAPLISPAAGRVKVRVIR